MLAGLLIVLLGTIMGAAANNGTMLLVSRAIESIGFILTVLPGPSLLRSLVEPNRSNRWLGIWATYMPVGAAMGLVVAPWISTLFDWRTVWIVHAALAGIGAFLLLRWLPIDKPRDDHSKNESFTQLLGETVRTAGPWLLALSFAAYAGQYLSIIAFLPTIYQQAGVSASTAGLMTALVAVINVLGNIGAGQLIHRNVGAPTLIAIAAVVLMVGTWMVYGWELPILTRYLIILFVSAVMGLVPGSLFVLAAQLAPRSQAVSTTVGLMQQGSAVGQLVLPVLVGWVATQSGGWQNTYLATGAFAAVNLVIAFILARRSKK